MGLAFVQFEGPKYAFDLPSFKSLKVRRTELVAADDDHPMGTIVITGTAYNPRRLEWHDDWKLVIDHKTGVIDVADWWVITPKHGDGDKYGWIAGILGIPGILVCLPALLPWWGIRSLLTKATGLDVHQQAFFVKVRPQLPASMQVTLLKALRKQNTEEVWAYRSELSKRKKAREEEKKEKKENA